MAEFDFNTLRAEPTANFDFDSLRILEAPDDQAKVARRAKFVAEQRSLEANDDSVVLGMIKELGSLVGSAGAEQASNIRAGGEYVRSNPGTPFVSIPKPEAKPDEAKATQFVKGVARAGIGAVEAAESPAGAMLLAAGGIPVAGAAILRLAGGGFGLHSLYSSIRDWYQGKIETPQQAGEAAGNAAVGALMLKGALRKGKAAPAEATTAAEAAPSEPSSPEAAKPETSTEVTSPAQEPTVVAQPQGTPPETVTSIKNAVVDHERAERSLPEAEPVLKSTFGKVWDEAMGKIERDPTYTDSLLGELRSKPRALTDVEDATLLHRQVELQNAFDKTQKDLTTAYEFGDEAAKFEASVRFHTLSDQLLDLYDIGKKAGTETGRGLAARKMLAKENFTLARMVTEARAAKGGRQLTDEELNTVAKQHDEVQRTDSELADYVALQDDPTAFDENRLKLQAASERAKEVFQQGVEKDKRADRSLTEQAQDVFVKWRRGFLLSSPVTLGKLTAAAVVRMASTPVEEAVGAGIGKAIPSVAAKANIEGGLSLNAEAKAITSALTTGMADAWDTLKTGRSNLDRVYGSTRLIEDTAIDFFGHVHGALKAPVKRAAFARAFAKATEFDMRNGVDVTDPLVQTKNAMLAYKEANKSIFLQDNRVVNAYQRAVTALEQPSPKTGEVSAGGKALATTAKTLLPIVKVPTNIVGETLQYATGLVTGSTRLALAARKGLDTLSEDDANLIMRELKKGSVGNALLLLGFLAPEMFGGYYQRGEKRPEADVKYGAARLYGVDIPSAALHNPLLETLQLGATVRRVSESKLRKRDEEVQGIPAGLMAGALGLIGEVPFVREMNEVSKAYDPASRGAFFGELTKSLVVPQAIQWAAQQMDKDASGDVILRKPDGIVQHIETGIPGLRQEVPEKPQQVERLFKRRGSLLKGP